jgi:hypothetical protein
MKTLKQCRFCKYGSFGDPFTLGQCRKNAPSLRGWPTVKPNAWCGKILVETVPTLRRRYADFMSDDGMSIHKEAQHNH